MSRVNHLLTHYFFFHFLHLIKIHGWVPSCLGSEIPPWPHDPARSGSPAQVDKHPDACHVFMDLWLWPFPHAPRSPSCKFYPTVHGLVSVESRRQVASESSFVFLSAFEVKGQTCLVTGGVSRAFLSSWPNNWSDATARSPFSFPPFCYPWILVNSPTVLPLHHLEFGPTAPNLRRWNVLCTTTARTAVFFPSLCPWSEPAVETSSASWYSSLPKPCSRPSLSLTNMWWITPDMWF